MPFDENNRSGYILLYTSLIEHERYGFKKPFSDGEAFIWLLCNACRKPDGRQRVINGMHLVEEYGQYWCTIPYLESIFGWGSKKIRNWIKRGIQFGDFSKNTAYKRTLLTICNFDTYQNRGQSKGPTEARPRPDRGPTEGSNLITLLRKHVNTATPETAVIFYLLNHYKIHPDKGNELLTKYGERELWRIADIMECKLRNKATAGEIKNTAAWFQWAINSKISTPPDHIPTILGKDFYNENEQDKQPDPETLNGKHEQPASVEDETVEPYDEIFSSFPADIQNRINDNATEAVRRHILHGKRFRKMERDGLPVDEIYKKNKTMYYAYLVERNASIDVEMG